MSMMKFDRRKAFTLVELLTVIAIMGVLAGLILPAIRKAKVKAKMTECANNMLQFTHAIDLFRTEHDDEFPDWLSNLYPHYINSKKLYLCPADYCTQGASPPRNSHRGADGGKPWWESDRTEYAETDDTKFNGDFDKQAHPRNSELSRQDSSYDTVDYCSYMYTFCAGYCSWKHGYTWKEAMMEKRAEAAHRGRTTEGLRGRVPILRCFWHQRRRPGTNDYVPRVKGVLNVDALNKNVFYSNATDDNWWK
jgi:prepilin-type N-terminal cleavage/methylation domain-containing protein